MAGYGRDEVVGKNCRFLQGPETSEESVDRIREAIGNVETVTVELKNYRKDGTGFWNKVTISPIYEEVEGVVNYFGFQEEVTERVERERGVKEKREQAKTPERTPRKA